MTFRGTPDWFGNSSLWNPEMAFEVKDDQLLFQFRAAKAPHCDKSLGRGDFVEGLWEQDVAEIFLAGPNGRYQEINLSPVGAWWSAVFSAYRERERVARFRADIRAEIRQDSWEIRFSAKLQDLEAWRDLPRSELKASVTAILHGPEPAFFAWNHTVGGEPDFHRADLFRKF
jgi:hypothetical protein